MEMCASTVLSEVSSFLDNLVKFVNTKQISIDASPPYISKILILESEEQKLFKCTQYKQNSSPVVSILQK